MTGLDAAAIRGKLGAFASRRLEGFEVFAEIESTNSHLLRQPAPPPGRVRVAITDNQTAGRGRHGRRWQSPPGSGLCLSLGYTFAEQPADLPALTLAIGLGVTDALAQVGVSGILLKWPNDLMANDGKLGGILTETRSLAGDAVMVVTGIGLNVDLGPMSGRDLESVSMREIADLAGHVETLPPRDELAARVIESVCRSFADYASAGFAALAPRWPRYDWLFGRELVVDTAQQRVAGTGAGVAADGALLLKTAAGAVLRITSGSVVVAGSAEEGS